MAWAGSKLWGVLKLLRHGAGAMVRLGVLCVERGFCTDDEIRRHNETRAAAGLPSIEEEAAIEEDIARQNNKAQRPAKNPHVVRRGGKLL